MQANVGSIDKVARIIIGLAVILAGFYFSSWWGALGLVPLLTAIISWCPLYMPFGISSCKK